MVPKGVVSEISLGVTYNCVDVVSAILSIVELD